MCGIHVFSVYGLHSCREEGMTYSQFINALSVKGFDVNRKILADLAMNEPASFKALVASAKA